MADRLLGRGGGVQDGEVDLAGIARLAQLEQLAAGEPQHLGTGDLADLQHLGRRTLRVRVGQLDGIAPTMGGDRQVDGDGGLTGPALAGDDSDILHQATSSSGGWAPAP